jgi:hypothetical protein
MRKQIGLRIKDETRDQVEKVRGKLSRTDYIEGAVLTQIARDLKPELQTETRSILRMKASVSGTCPICSNSMRVEDVDTDNPVDIIESDLRDDSRIDGGDVYRSQIQILNKRPLPKGFAVRSSAESRAGVMPVPKNAQRGRK